jgi:hypothetical protein
MVTRDDPSVKRYEERRRDRGRLGGRLGELVTLSSPSEDFRRRPLNDTGAVEPRRLVLPPVRVDEEESKRVTMESREGIVVLNDVTVVDDDIVQGLFRVWARSTIRCPMCMVLMMWSGKSVPT